MPANLVIPPCEQNPTHPNHFPRHDKPLRVQILGLNETINQLFNDGTKMPSQERPITSAVDFDEAGIRLAKMAFKLLYGRDVNSKDQSDFVPRYHVDGYGITFDHLIPDADDDPETLMMNVCDPFEPEASIYFKLDLERYKTGLESSVLLVLRCCQLRKGSTDRKGINDQVKTVREHQRPQLCGEAGMGTS
ncbi:hypothetical protein TOPH_06519 [Tolypocladium ophioglossoides CBS 100239]|uniref:Uncharacterized protein n=1 Tax=Tolypocladium ophioglossoides (strain CBS 100239) TaxID=1163406 RepID=A0A0L0N4Q9_TOLOC|nr:hypothetical protein TOPH_06519 [Tolypocladium ophioglossoides CBS 100239]